jgi:hypothetical protein
MKIMNLQNMQVKRMPSTETRMTMQSTADRVKAANNHILLGNPPSQLGGAGGNLLPRNPEEQKKL